MLLKYGLSGVQLFVLMLCMLRAAGYFLTDEKDSCHDKTGCLQQRSGEHVEDLILLIINDLFLHTLHTPKA